MYSERENISDIYICHINRLMHCKDEHTRKIATKVQEGKQVNAL